MRISIWKNIPVLRGVAMCSVVMAHASNAAFGPVFNEINILDPRLFPIKTAFIFLIKSVAHFGLLAFLFASGFMYYKLNPNLPAAKRISLDILKKYIIWAVPLFLFISLKNGDIHIKEILSGLIKGGPMPAYWYLVLIAVIYIISPIWISLVRNHLKTTILIITFLQGINFFRYYYSFHFTEIVLPGFIESLIIRPLLFSPFFVLGLILSKHVKFWSLYLQNKGYILSILVIGGIFFCIAESFFWFRYFDYNTNCLDIIFNAERISLVCLFLIGTLYILSRTNEKKSLVNFFSNVGISSFGIFLMTDIFSSILNTFLWQTHILLSKYSTIPFNYSSTQTWLSNASIWLFFLYFANGLWGPLLAMKWLRKTFGKKVRYLW